MNGAGSDTGSLEVIQYALCFDRVLLRAQDGVALRTGLSYFILLLLSIAVRNDGPTPFEPECDPRCERISAGTSRTRAECGSIHCSL